MTEDRAASDRRPEKARAVARLMVADIERLSLEFPQYDREVIAGLFRVLTTATGYIPTYGEVLARLEGYRESMPNARLRRLFVTSLDRASSRDAGARKGTDPALAPAPARGGRPRGRTTTIRDDEDYRRRWARYLGHCRQDGRSPTVRGFSTWTGVDVDGGSYWPHSTIKDYRRRASLRGVDLPPAT